MKTTNTTKTTSNKKDFEQEVLMQLSNIDDNLELLNNNMMEELTNKRKEKSEKELEQKAIKEVNKTFLWILIPEWIGIIFAFVYLLFRA